LGKAEAANTSAFVLYRGRQKTGRITAIRTGRKGRVKIYVDGQAALNLGEKAAASLEIGQKLPEELAGKLARADRFQQCLDAAMHYLAYRPRSESELRERLRRRGFDSEDIDGAMVRLTELGLIEDITFTRFWVENREVFSPRSRRLTGLELRRKGVAGEVISQAVQEINDGESAYRAALSRAPRLPQSDYSIFHRRLGAFLRRRGFDYETINKTIKQVWQETGGRGNSPD